MNAFFAMNVPTTYDDRGYLLWAAQNWMFLVLPAIAFITFVIAWTVQRVRACSAGTPGGPGFAPPSPVSGMTEDSGASDSSSDAEAQGQTLWTLLPRHAMGTHGSVLPSTC